MDETLLFPSPNWFLVSNLAVSKDGWIIYGGPSKSICVLEPRNEAECVIAGGQTFQVHTAIRAHLERVISVDISPEFPEKRNFISGSADGTVKQWTMEKVNKNYKIKSTLSHEIHYQEKEEITGVGYSTNTIAITVGCFGHIVKWDLSSNVCKTYTKFLSNFRPTCMSCSPHIPLNVAIGTKQGVIFVLDLTGNGKIVYKVRSHDDEITNISWCPQYELLVNKTLKVLEKAASVASRLESIKNEAVNNILEQSGIVKGLPVDSFDESIVELDDMFDIYKDHEADEFGHKKYEPEDIIVVKEQERSEKHDFLAECFNLKEEILKRKNQGEPSIESLVEALDKTHVDHSKAQAESFEPQIESSEHKARSSDGFVESVEVHAGHLEPKAESFRPHIEGCDPQPGTSKSGVSEPIAGTTGTKPKKKNEKKTPTVTSSAHVHKHLLATIGRLGGVRIWSKSGKLVGSCVISFINCNKNNKNKVVSWPTLLWHRPNQLLLVDGKSQLLECNPLRIDCKNKLDWRVVHALHKRGLYAIATDAPRKQTAYDSPDSPDFHESAKWSIYTVSQDRYIIRYNMKSRKPLAIHNTCGGFLYTVQPCPYDAGKIAVSVGDGAVRVWQSATLANDDTKMYPGRVQTYWQNVQGKVLTVAWHPTKENCLAFATAESRVGIIDTTGKLEKPARVLRPAVTVAVYSLCWGEGMQLYANGGDHLVVYDTARDEAPKEVDVIVEGQKWVIPAITWNSRGLLCGSDKGAVAVLNPTTHKALAVAFVFDKIIHSMVWHPLQTSNSSEESSYKNLIAVTSLDRSCNVAILEYKDKEGGGKELTTWKTLSGHKMPVLQVDWNPHCEELLLSTSQDTTIRVWDIISGTCISIFGNHMQHSLGATWCAMPQFETKIISGGGDFALRLWDYNDHKAEDFEKIKHTVVASKTKKPVKKETNVLPKEESDQSEVAANVVDIVRKPSQKFILTTLHKQINPCKVEAVKIVYDKYVKGKSAEQQGGSGDSEVYDMDFIKIFGTINEVNEVLDMEMKVLLEEDVLEAWITLAIFRGQIDSMIQFASQKDILCPYLLSMAPCVSFKYWKEATQLYVAQIDRLIAKGKEEKLHENRRYGGAVFKKAAALLSIHDIKGAVATLTEAKLFKEAYVLCRIRYLDSIAEETLRQWADYSCFNGRNRIGAICYMVLGDIAEAATALSKYNDKETLDIAVDLAKSAGRMTFADHVEKKAQTSALNSKLEETEEQLKDLPSRAELLLKQIEEFNDLKNDEDEGAIGYNDDGMGQSENKIDQTP